MAGRLVVRIFPCTDVPRGQGRNNQWIALFCCIHLSVRCRGSIQTVFGVYYSPPSPSSSLVQLEEASHPTVHKPRMHKASRIACPGRLLTSLLLLNTSTCPAELPRDEPHSILVPQYLYLLKNARVLQVFARCRLLQLGSAGCFVFGAVSQAPHLGSLLLTSCRKIDGGAAEFNNPRQLVPVQYGMMLPRLGEVRLVNLGLRLPTCRRRGTSTVAVRNWL